MTHRDAVRRIRALGWEPRARTAFGGGLMSFDAMGEIKGRKRWARGLPQTTEAKAMASCLLAVEALKETGHSPYDLPKTRIAHVYPGESP